MKADAPDNWLEICAEEMQRGKLTSLPLKFEFAKERGMKGLDEVHVWMVTTRRNFVEMVEAALHSQKQAPCPCPDAMKDCACNDKAQCWEPCGELGKSEAHVLVAGETSVR